MDGRPDIIFYDGHCGLCHRWVRYAIARDPEGARFRFAPLQGEELRRHLTAEQRRALPDSIVLISNGGDVLVKSDGVLHVLSRLGGAGRFWAKAGGVLPRPVRDAGYDLVAAIRGAFFRRPPDLCPVVPPELRDRFLP